MKDLNLEALREATDDRNREEPVLVRAELVRAPVHLNLQVGAAVGQDPAGGRFLYDELPIDKARNEHQVDEKTKDHQVGEHANSEWHLRESLEEPLFDAEHDALPGRSAHPSGDVPEPTPQTRLEQSDKRITTLGCVMC